MHTLLVFIAFAVALAQPASAATVRIGKYLNFSGYRWAAVDRYGHDAFAQGRHFHPSNAWVDRQGRMHLRIRKFNGKWTCVDVFTTRKLGFGTYQWKITARLDKLDRNIVVGLFNYGPMTDAEWGIHEIDIEYAQWGDRTAPRGHFTVHGESATPVGSRTFNFALGGGSHTTQRFRWERTRISFWSLKGFRRDADFSTPYAAWVYRPTLMSSVPQVPLQLHMNMWLNWGRAPTNGKPVEIVVTAFKKI